MSAQGIVGDAADLTPQPLAGDGIRDVVKRVLVAPDQGWDGWVMRLFDVAPGGHTPRHTHPWPHINFVAGGAGELEVEGEVHALAAGSYAYVPAGAEHQFRAAPDAGLSFVCIVPEVGEV